MTLYIKYITLICTYFVCVTEKKYSRISAKRKMIVFLQKKIHIKNEEISVYGTEELQGNHITNRVYHLLN